MQSLRLNCSDRICARKTDVDTSRVNSLQPRREKVRSSRAPKSAVVLMLIIVGSMVLLAVYANIQHFRRDKVETVIGRPATSPTARTHQLLTDVSWYSFGCARL